MHQSTCNCPKCRTARAERFESEPFRYEIGEGGATELDYPLTEAEEIELALELLAVSNDAEMDQFLGKLFKGIGRGLKKVGSFLGKKVFKPVGRALKSVAKKALPFLGGALGSFIPIPGVGTAIGTALGTAASKALELEFGGSRGEEAELEMAQRFVRMAATAARQAALSPPDLDEEAVIDAALSAAARKHLPYLHLSEYERLRVPGRAHAGRWIRRGRRIFVMGA